MSSVSVVIPCYKYGHFLEEAVASVLDDQPGVDVRALIIDDASPDDSAEMARKIAARDPRVEVIVHATNKGNIATYNEGLLEWADGDYCVLMSADDRLTPGALRRATDLLDAHPGVGFVYGHSLWVMDGAPLPTAREPECGAGRCGPASGGLSGVSARRRTPLRRRRSSCAHRCRSGWADMTRDCPVPPTWRCICGWRRTPMLASYAEWTRPTTGVHGKNMSKAVSPLMDLRQRRSVFEIVT